MPNYSLGLSIAEAPILHHNYGAKYHLIKMPTINPMTRYADIEIVGKKKMNVCKLSYLCKNQPRQMKGRGPHQPADNITNRTSEAFFVINRRIFAAKGLTVSPSLADIPIFVRKAEIYFSPEYTQNACRWNLALPGFPQSFYNEKRSRLPLVSLNMNINDEKISGLALGLHPINIKTRPRQVSRFNNQLADFPEPPPSFSNRNSLTDKKTSSIP